jgi:hypothetical protein
MYGAKVRLPPPPPHVPAGVVTLTALLLGDMPALSEAATVNWWLLDGCNPKIEALVPETLLWTAVLPSNTV